MNEALLSALLTEYTQLSSSFDKHMSVGYNTPPIALTVITGFLVINHSVNGLSGSPFGLGISLAVFFLLVWLGISHTSLNCIGLRLVELEFRINKLVTESATDGLTFYTSYIGTGSPGLLIYIILVIVVAGTACVIAQVQFWNAMETWGLQFRHRFAAIVFVVGANVAATINMCLVERTIRKLRRELIERYNADPDKLTQYKARA